MTAPAPRPVVTGIGGGMGARLAAVGTVIALGSIVWIGASGRPSVTPVRSQPPVVAQASPTIMPEQMVTPVPTGTPRPTAQATAAATPELEAPATRRPAVGSPMPPNGFSLALAGTVGDDKFHIAFAEVRRGLFFGEHWTRSPPASDTLAFEILELRRRGGLERGRSIGTWELSLAELAGNARAGTDVLAVTHPARPGLARAPVLVRRGFQLTVSVRLAFQEVAVIYFQVQVGERPRNQVQGDDGLVGCRGFLTCDLD